MVCFGFGSTNHITLFYTDSFGYFPDWKDHLLNVFKLTGSYIFFLAAEAIMIAQRKKHVGDQYRAMHFGSVTRWQSGRKMLNNVFVSY